MTRALLLVVVFAAGTARADVPRKPPPAKPVPCNADELDKQGDRLRALGNDRMALVSYDKALQCTPTERRYARAVFVICKIANHGVYPNGPGPDRSLMAKAKAYLDHVPTQRRAALYQACAPPCVLE